MGYGNHQEHIIAQQAGVGRPGAPPLVLAVLPEHSHPELHSLGELSHIFVFGRFPSVLHVAQCGVMSP